VSDPTSQGWRPEHRIDADVPRPTHGQRFGAHLYYLYRAGRNEIPAVAALYSELTRRVHHLTASMHGQFDLPGQVVGRAHRRILELRDEVHDVLRKTTLRLEEAGAALVVIADRYAATDEEAAAHFAALLDRNADDFRHHPPIVPTPPAVDAPPPLRHPGRM
jgi:hypothetical protein